MGSEYGRALGRLRLILDQELLLRVKKKKRPSVAPDPIFTLICTFPPEFRYQIKDEFVNHTDSNKGMLTISEVEGPEVLIMNDGPVLFCNLIYFVPSTKSVQR